MRASLKSLLVAGGALALLASGGAARAAEDDMSLGNPGAKVTVIEYASVTCPHCARWETEVFPGFKAKYVDTGKVRFVFRELPTAPAPLAEAGFLVARCAGQSKYFDVIHSLMVDQEQLRKDGDGRGWLMRAAAAAGLSESQTEDCVKDEAAQKALEARITANLKQFDVQGTPQFFVNGKKLGEGEVTPLQLDRALEPLLAPKPEPVHEKPEPKGKGKGKTKGKGKAKGESTSEKKASSKKSGKASSKTEASAHGKAARHKSKKA